MPIAVSRLRRWFLLGAVAVSLMVVGAYFHARYRARNALKEVPGKIGLEIQQSAQGFTISKSDAGRTLFKVQASKAVQFKETGRAELHDVNIILYGSDASRFDQIYGADFEYDPKSGDVTAKGEVQIDLEANPAGLTSADQAPPRKLKNPIHLRTRGLVFNHKTGNAYTRQKIEFSVPQASGSALGASYSGKSNILTLESQLHVVLNGSRPAVASAMRGIISQNPRQVVLENPRLVRGAQTFAAERATLLLGADNTVEQVRASGGITAQFEAHSPVRVRARELHLALSGPKHNLLRSATLSGDVQAESPGEQASAGRVVLDFRGENRLARVHAEDNVRLVQSPKASPQSSGPQKVSAQEVVATAPAMDFTVAGGRRLERGETSGAAQIAIFSSGASAAGPRTVVTAGKFTARFDKSGRLASVLGAPQARITSSNPGQPDRVSSSDVLDAAFLPAGGIASLLQQGHVAYTDGARKAWADRARYSPANQVLTLSGSPRVAEAGMTTTAHSMRLDRTTGDAFAEGGVKSTYSVLKAQADGALLASSSPIHITALSMTAHRTPASAVYAGDVRLWQDANVVEAASLEFDRDRRSMLAKGTPSQNVSTVLVQTDQTGKSTPVTISSARLSYADTERTLRFDGGVLVRGADLAMRSNQMDVLLAARGQSPADQTLSSQSRLERIVASGNVVITQPQRRASGDQLVYTASEAKFVLSGGSPSIFDAEHGKITGDSLTFFQRDDRVLVEGRDSSPTITHTRVAR